MIAVTVAWTASALIAASAATAQDAQEVRNAGAVDFAVGLVLDGPPELDLRAFDERVSRALLEEGFSRTLVPPVGFDDLALAAGCRAADLTGCLDRVATALAVSGVVLRRARGTADAVSMELVYRDPSSPDAPARVSRVAARDALVLDAPALVRALFGDPVLTTERPGVGVGTWVTLASGAALVAAGALLGASAAWGDQASLHATTSADVDRIESALDAAQTRALTGDVLLAVGAAVLVVGVVLLVIELTRAPRTTEAR